MNIIILGPQASGKGTQAELLADKLNLYHLESGQMLRKIATHNKRIDEIINVKGELVPDEETLRLIAGVIQENNALERGVIFDGFPRTVEQYHLLKKWLADRGQKIDIAIFLEVSEMTVSKRLSARRVCKSCAEIYNLITNPPKQANICDRCGGELIQREDDKPDVIKKRLTIYRNETEPMIELMAEEGLLIKIDGEKEIEMIFAEIMQKLKN